VDGDESYTANNAIVHNCTDLSFAGKQSGLIVNSFEDYMELRNEYLKTGNEDLYYHNGKFQQSILFWEYLRILKDIREVNPDVLFLLENVGMKKVFQKQFNDNLGIHPVNINSNLVSAQNRNRWYWTNIRTKSVGLFGEIHSDIPQPEDRGILLKDILQDESEVDKKYYISDAVVKRMDRRNYSNPKINPDKTGTLNTTNNSARMCLDSGTTFVKIDKPMLSGIDINGKAPTQRSSTGTGLTDQHNYQIIKLDKQGNKKADQDKAGCLTAGGHSGGNHSDMDIICVAMRGMEDGQELEPKTDGKTNCLTSVSKDNLILQLPHGANKGGYRATDGKVPSITTSAWEYNNLLHDGYTLRRLTEKECDRLQTVPEWYVWKCSSTQHYRMLGNGFTIEVIKWILSFLPKT
jgi:DNA (cytosine-5)-methyltransferase 3A